MIKHSHRSSIFNIKADLNKSHGSYLYDLNTKREVLDLFSMYSSLPLGYNHLVFDEEEFVNESHSHLGVKVTNCEFNTPAVEQFVHEFTNHPSMRPFSHFHFACTGALAIEAAVKTSFVARGRGQIGTFENSFHGINGYGGLLAADSGPASRRLSGFPVEILSYVFVDPTALNQEELLERIEFKSQNFSAIILEPIQCTAGDRVLDVDFLRAVHKLCASRSMPLIFDEIQTGFGTTGTMWYFEQLGFTPDIVVFGKKTQVSGIMVNEKYSHIFKQPSRLEVTWDGDALDMIRCRAILNAYSKYNILENVKWRGEQLQKGLTGLGLNVRRVGLLLAIDFPDRTRRDDFVKNMWEDQATIMIPTGESCVRLRPNLAVTAAEIHDVIRRVGRIVYTSLSA